MRRMKELTLFEQLGELKWTYLSIRGWVEWLCHEADLVWEPLTPTATLYMLKMTKSINGVVMAMATTAESFDQLREAMNHFAAEWRKHTPPFPFSP